MGIIGHPYCGINIKGGIVTEIEPGKDFPAVAALVRQDLIVWRPNLTIFINDGFFLLQ
jgi:hypothetical protein